MFLVNRRGGAILGEPAYRSLQELPERPELVVISLRAAAFEAAVDESLQVGARAIVAITAGLGEKDAEGLAIQGRCAQRCRAAGALLVGPNCLGIADLTTELDLTWDHLAAGDIAFVTQSGNIGLELAELAKQARLGFSRFISLGNQADLDAADSIEALIDHPPTRVIGVYIEDFEDGRRLATVSKRAGDAGKPVILLTVGASAASRRMARSHTGALVSDSLAVDAACRASGMYRVRNPVELIDLAQLLLMKHPPKGPRMSVVGDGGGHVALASDRLVAHGLNVDAFTAPTAQRLAAALPATATTANPVDVAGGGEEDIWCFERAVRIMAQSGEADGVLLTGYFGGYSEQQMQPWSQAEVQVATAMSEAATAVGCPLIVQTMYPRSPTAKTFRDLGVPVFADIEAPARALGHVIAHIIGKPLGVPGQSPPPSARLPSPLRGGLGRGYFEVRSLLGAAGIPFVEAHAATSENEALTAARAIGYPIVLKALGMTHKSDVGGVRLAIATDEELREAFADLRHRLRPPLFSVEREAPIELGVELIIGLKRDRSFGPLAMVGLGGLHAELFRDVAVALAPVSHDQALSLIHSLHGSQLLLGWRGRPRLDVEGAARALQALSSVGSQSDEIAELEVNPLLVLEHEVLGLDARVVLDQEPPSDAA